MHIVRTIVWVLLAVWGLFFFGLNWGEPVPVKFWPIPTDNPLMVEQPVSLVAAIFFLLGLVPMWLYSRAQKWMLKRRIHSLEQAARYVMPPPVNPVGGEASPEPDPQPQDRPPLI
jgi:putative membrane protein